MFSGWLFWALGASLVWSFGQVFSRKGLSYFTPLAYNFISVPFGLLIHLPYAFFNGIRLDLIGPLDVLLMVVIAGTLLAYYYVIAAESVSLSGTVISIYPLSTIFFSHLFLGERLSSAQAFFILLIFGGVVLIGWPEGHRRFNFRKWFWLALGAAVAIGFGDFLAKVVIGRIGIGNYFLLYDLAFLPGLFAAFALDRKGRTLPRLPLKLWTLSLLGTSLISAGSIFFFTAFAKGPASLVSPVASSYTALTVILALIFLKEKLRRFQAVGVALAVLGTILIGV